LVPALTLLMGLVGSVIAMITSFLLVLVVFKLTHEI
jgi:hypothetical protein